MLDAVRPRFGWRFAAITLVAVALAVLTFSLGRWQLSRAAGKLAQHAAMLQEHTLAPLSERELVREFAGRPDAEPAFAFRRVILHGKWLADATLYLDNRQLHGRPGFYVFTPLRLSGSHETVAVQRGWAPRNFDDRTVLPQVASPAGEVVVQGYVAGEPGRLFEFSHAAGAQGASRIRQNLTVAGYATELSLNLLPLTVVQTGEASDGLQRDWPAPDSGVDMHYGYAFQWFGLCALVTMLYVWFQIIRRFPRRERHAPR